jgi:hypothetical protein
MLLIINVFVDKMFIYVIIAGLNSLQGLYVFIAYMCNKRVYRMYTNKFCGARQLVSGQKSPSMDTLSRWTIYIDVESRKYVRSWFLLYLRVPDFA